MNLEVVANTTNITRPTPILFVHGAWLGKSRDLSPDGACHDAGKLGGWARPVTDGPMPDVVICVDDGIERVVFP